MSNFRLSLLVLLCLVGIALTLSWYLAAESRALAATRPPVEVEVGDAQEAETGGLPVRPGPNESTASRPEPRPTPVEAPRRAATTDLPRSSAAPRACAAAPSAVASFVQ